MRTANNTNIEEVVLYTDNDHKPITAMARRLRPAGTGPLMPVRPGAIVPATATRYSIRFHLKSGKHMDMHINEFDNWGERNNLINAKKILAMVDSKLQEHDAWISNSDDDPSQNFRVFDHALEAIEIVTR